MRADQLIARQRFRSIPRFYPSAKSIDFSDLSSCSAGASSSISENSVDGFRKCPAQDSAVGLSGRQPPVRAPRWLSISTGSGINRCQSRWSLKCWVVSTEPPNRSRSARRSRFDDPIGRTDKIPAKRLVGCCVFSLRS